VIRRLTSLGRRVTGLLAAGLLVAACVGLPSSPSGDTQHFYGLFSDARDLVVGAPVDVRGVPSGSVTSITLSGSKARIAFALPAGIQVPDSAAVTLEPTGLLGQDVLDLTWSSSTKGPYLSNGDRIDSTGDIGSIEDLVTSGSQLLGAVSASDLASIIDQAAVGFGGQGPKLRSVIDNLASITAAYHQHQSQLDGAITGLDRTMATLAASSASLGAAIGNLKSATGALASQSTQLNQLVDSLNRLGDQGNRLLAAATGELNTTVVGATDLINDLASRQEYLGLILHWLPLHNRATSLGETNDFLQVLIDFVLCGPGLQTSTEANSPARSCHFVPQAGELPPPASIPPPVPYPNGAAG
jgi:phospholipid/cholesterol/gamma-HCH transport system substrate-binding protein